MSKKVCGRSSLLKFTVLGSHTPSNTTSIVVEVKFYPLARLPASYRYGRVKGLRPNGPGELSPGFTLGSAPLDSSARLIRVADQA